uniref:uncharacterized protein LOC127067717 isoform X4 n=1 Tax=Vespula vulgaris TaxID=7454 RepID=UPI00223AA25A|nr:uncharacterized protein LOC127067717 isoform X4 [Vespula vulgaris]
MNEELEKQISKVKSLDTAIKKFDNNVEILQSGKNCKKSGIQKDKQLSLNICNTHSISTSDNTISTTISTLQNVDEEILLELLEDSKIMMASSAEEKLQNWN